MQNISTKFLFTNLKVEDQIDDMQIQTQINASVTLTDENILN